MPMLYFKCECGTEHREIVPISKAGGTDRGNGRTAFFYDPTAVKAEPTVRTHVCSDCGEPVSETQDPQAVPSGVYFNWLEGY